MDPLSMSCPLYDSPKPANYYQLRPTTTNYDQLLPSIAKLVPTTANTHQIALNLLPTIARFDQLLPTTIANSYQLLLASIAEIYCQLLLSTANYFQLVPNRA